MKSLNPDEKTAERDNKKNEYWIHKGSWGACSELEYDYDTCEFIKESPDEFYDVISFKDTIRGGIHVIRYDYHCELIEKAREQGRQEILDRLPSEEDEVEDAIEEWSDELFANDQPRVVGMAPGFRRGARWVANKVRDE